jgi:hypothetical protein
MRKLRVAVAGFAAWLALDPLAAAAGSRYGSKVEQLPEGVGCYWHVGHLFCSRWCYVEIDGFRYCQRRMRDAASQAPAVLLYDFEPRRYDRIRRGPVVLDDAAARAPGRDRPIK